MPGQILIMDALSNRRIHLRAILDTACYDVDQAASQTEGLRRIRTAPPDVVIVAHDLPGLGLQQFCKRLRLDPKTQFTTVIVAVPRENHSARISALTAGAADVVEYMNDPDDLQARIRSFMRLRQTRRDTALAASPSQALGFAEEQRRFEKPVSVTIVADGPVDIPASLANSRDLVVSVTSMQEARRPAGAESDVYVVYETADPAENRNLLAALRSNAATCHAAILYVTGHKGPHSVSAPLDLGAQDQVTTLVSDRELSIRVHRLAQRKRDDDRARAELSTLGEKAYTDGLTGLHNRGFAGEYLKKQDRLLEQSPASLCLVMLDIDRFKTVNDTHSHAAGDAILNSVAHVLRSHLRASDMVARMGGDEFLIALPQVGKIQARSVAERLRREIASRSTALGPGTVARVTVSIGLALSSRGFRKATKDLTQAADNALYRAKANGRNRIETAIAEDYQMRRPNHPALAPEPPFKVG